VAALEELKSAMIDPHPAGRITVEGHTDNVGADADNQRLSEARAQAVVRWLTQRGVPASRITAQGLGETRPAYSNDTPAERAKNRRIQIIVENP
jgi:outer membrane protein OmpA-like peptidoglycan-associated protein